MAYIEEGRELYRSDHDFPGYDMSETEVMNFWGIAADHVLDTNPERLGLEFERILKTYGEDADYAIYAFLGYESVGDLLALYKEVDADSFRSLEKNWKEEHIVNNLTYYIRVHQAQLKENWQDDTRWLFWEYYNVDQRSPEAIDEIAYLLSGCHTLFEWIAASR